MKRRARIGGVRLITLTIFPVVLMAQVCEKRDLQRVSEAKGLRIIDKVVDQPAGYVDQVFVMPIWYGMTMDQKRGLAINVICSLRNLKLSPDDSIHIHDARDGKMIARWSVARGLKLCPIWPLC
jgi:hypothetical protein